MSTAIWWIRRDLRLSDNQALSAALRLADNVVPVFILDPHLLSSPYVAQRRTAFLFEGLRVLKGELSKLGSGLIIRRGEPREILHRLITETSAQSIFAEADVSPYARQRDGNVKLSLPLTLTPGVTVHPPEMLVKPDGTAYSVFTPFRRRWHSLHFTSRPLPAPQRLPAVPELPSLDLSTLPDQFADSHFPAGEMAALRKLDEFLENQLNHYAEARNRMDLAGTSGISPYLRFGMISARQTAWKVGEAQAQAQDSASRLSAEAWLNELIWRDFFASVLFHFPFVRRKSFRENLRHILWQEDSQAFSAWAEGYTGYPVVDAGMRQLNATGWMHNRARMIAASFFTKDLLIDWRKGEQYFMQHLLDGDPSANNGGWQWAAGTGTDAVPYFRIFNPTLQGQKFDPQGVYIRRWVPELTGVPDEYIHIPWKMPGPLQMRLGCVIGKDYPAPIIDHSLARQRAMATYRAGTKKSVTWTTPV